MKLTRVLLSTAAVIVMAGAAHAADLIVDVPATAPVAVAETGWYLSVFAGGVWDGFNSTDDINDAGTDLDIDSDMGWLVGAAVGGHLWDNVRGEIELSGSSRDSSTFSLDGVGDFPADAGTITTTALMGNLWYDFNAGSGFTPYIGGGLGVGYVHAVNDDFGLDVDGVGLAYQIGAGVKFDVADNIAIDLGYRFKGFSTDLSGTFDDEDVDSLSNNLGSHVLQVGLTFGF